MNEARRAAPRLLALSRYVDDKSAGRALHGDYQAHLKSPVRYQGRKCVVISIIISIDIIDRLIAGGVRRDCRCCAAFAECGHRFPDDGSRRAAAASARAARLLPLRNIAARIRSAKPHARRLKKPPFILDRSRRAALSLPQGRVIAEHDCRALPSSIADAHLQSLLAGDHEQISRPPAIELHLR